MKKFIAMLLALCVVCSFAACGNTEPEVKLPESALSILETVWAAYPEEEKFYCGGGGYENMTENAPAAVLSTDLGALQGQLYVPETEIANISEAASLVHGMLLNNFTAGAYKVTDAAAFATAMESAIADVHWFCGNPEQLLIVTFGNSYAVVVFGLNDVVDQFQTVLAEAYPDAVVVVEKAIV